MVTREALFARHRASPFVGRSLTGRVEQTLVRGRTVYTRERGVLTDPGGGRVLHPT
jgi:allantoinase